MAIKYAKDQQFLTITMAPTAPPGQPDLLVDAAAKAGVPYVMPNCHGSDVADTKLVHESLVGTAVLANIARIEKAGVSSWVALVNGLWYEFCLIAGKEWSGLDRDAKTWTFFNEGKERVTFRVYVESFSANQRDMYESWKRVHGQTDADWNIAYQPAKERREQGLARMQTGDRLGFAQAMMARMFFPGEESNFEAKLENDVLGLEKEEIDDMTRDCKKMLDDGWTVMAWMTGNQGKRVNGFLVWCFFCSLYAWLGITSLCWKE